MLSPGPSPHTSHTATVTGHPNTGPRPHPGGAPLSGWAPVASTRPATSTTRETALTQPSLSQIQPPRPVTAPSQTHSQIPFPPQSPSHRQSPHDLVSLTLPPLSSIARHGHHTPSGTTLPPLRELHPQPQPQEREPAEQTEEKGVVFNRLTLPALQELRPSTRDGRPSSSSSSFMPGSDHHSFGRPTSSSSSAWCPPPLLSDARHSLSSVGSGTELLTPYREGGPSFFDRLHISDSARSSWDARPRTGGRPMTAERPSTSASASGFLASHREYEYNRVAERGNERPSTSDRVEDRIKDARDRTNNYDQLSQYSFGETTTTRLEQTRIPSTTQQGMNMMNIDSNLDAHSTPSSQYTAMPGSSHGLANSSNANAQINPNATYSRVLVGSLCSTCQRLQDAQGRSGLFFFAHDLGVRTEGTFTLRFSLTNLAS